MTKTEENDKDRATIKTMAETEDKDEDIDKGRNKLIQMFRYSKRWKDKRGNWKKRQIVQVFWDDGHVSEICEESICYDSNYAYTRFEELRTCSGEVLFIREHKATISKDESNIYIDIDELQMCKDFSTKDKNTTKTKTKTDDKDNNNTTTNIRDKTKDLLNKRIDTINKLNKFYQ